MFFNRRDDRLENYRQVIRAILSLRMIKHLITEKIKEEALRIGFDAVGVSPVHKITEDRLRDWLDRNYQGKMTYMEKHVEKRLDLGQVLDGARSLVSVALNYFHDEQLPYGDETKGVISRYAFGDDYHKVMLPKLRSLQRRIVSLIPEACARYYVDTGPIMDKYWAARGGIGWLGKNGNLIANKKLGSWFFIAEILLDVDLEYDSPTKDHCGTCTRCIDLCPTEAIVEPYVVDSRKCISYLTIELKEDIPMDLRSSMGNLIFGCDICQDVCPWNRKVRTSNEQAFQSRPQSRSPSLLQLASMDEKDFEVFSRKSALKRTKWRGLMRNVCVAMGNAALKEMVPHLKILLSVKEPMIRRHAAWALKQIGGEVSMKALVSRLRVERDQSTRITLTRLIESSAAPEDENPVS